MMRTESIQSLKNLIANGKTEVVLQELSTLVEHDPSMHDSAIGLSGQWSTLKRQYNMGLIDNDSWSRTRNRINYALLDLIRAIGDEAVLQNFERNVDEIAKPINNRNNIYKTELPSQQKKILFVASNPNKVQPLNVGREYKAVKDALDNSALKKNYLLEEALAAHPDELLLLLKRHRPAIVHISMHHSSETGLFFEDEAGYTYPISGELLSSLFELVNVRESIVECVVISACNSDGVAKLVSKYVRHVIGMQDKIPEIASLAFAKGFYQLYFEEGNVEDAFKAGKLRVKAEATRISHDSKIPLWEMPVLFPEL